MGGIQRQVVHGAVVGGPGRPRPDVGDLVGVQLAGTQVFEPQRVPLIAEDVDRVRQQVSIQAHRRGTQGEEFVALGFGIGIEQNLLAGDLGVLV